MQKAAIENEKAFLQKKDFTFNTINFDIISKNIIVKIPIFILNIFCLIYLH